MRVFLYVDGFNLYYRLLKQNAGTKWLDLEALGSRLFPSDQIVAVRYFTALIKPLDDPRAPARQQVYIRALNTLPNSTIHYGYFQLETKRRFLKNPTPGQPKTVEAVLPEEKGSDVNLATELLVDAFNARFDMAAIITNDADLAGPIRVVEHELGLPVTVVHPTQWPAGELRKVNPSTMLRLSVSTVRQSQFPETLTDDVGQFHRPQEWV